MQKTIRIDEAIVNDIQIKDIKAQVSRDILLRILDMHGLDANVSFMDSPIFKACEEEAVRKSMEYEKAKNEMAINNIPEDLYKSMKSWTLNYYTYDLVVVY